jgi:hypothetical protein
VPTNLAQTENAKSISYQGLSQRGINEKSVCIRGWSTKKHGHDGENVMSSETSITIWVKNTPKIAIFRMCYGENGTVKFLETLADNVFRHNLFGDNHVQSS